MNLKYLATIGHLSSRLGKLNLHPRNTEDVLNKLFQIYFLNYRPELTQELEENVRDQNIVGVKNQHLKYQRLRLGMLLVVMVKVLVCII